MVGGRRVPYLLLRGSVTYVNVKDGRHQSRLYVHPNTLERYGEPEGFAVVLSIQGQTVDSESKAGSFRGNWWEELPSREGQVLHRLQTPWAMVNFDMYEAIKPAGTGGR